MSCEGIASETSHCLGESARKFHLEIGFQEGQAGIFSQEQRSRATPTLFWGLASVASVFIEATGVGLGSDAAPPHRRPRRRQLGGDQRHL